jgi:hypothetical protein
MDVGGGSNEDDLTVKLQEILDVNVALELALTKGPQTRTIMEEWDFLQLQVAQYINGEMPGLQRMGNTKPMRGLCQRLKGKQGRFRGNLRYVRKFRQRQQSERYEKHALTMCNLVLTAENAWIFLLELSFLPIPISAAIKWVCHSR